MIFLFQRWDSRDPSLSGNSCGKPAPRPMTATWMAPAAVTPWSPSTRAPVPVDPVDRPPVPWPPMPSAAFTGRFHGRSGGWKGFGYLLAFICIFLGGPKVRCFLKCNPKTICILYTSECFIWNLAWFRVLSPLSVRERAWIWRLNHWSLPPRIRSSWLRCMCPGGFWYEKRWNKTDQQDVWICLDEN